MERHTHTRQPILVVDDELQALESVSLSLRQIGLRDIRTCADSREVLALLAQENFQVVILDLTMPHTSGEELLPRITNEFPAIAVIVMTAKNDVETAVACMRGGAFDYLLKPLHKERLVNSVKKALALYEVQSVSESLKDCIFTDTVKNPHAFSHIITVSEKMNKIFQYAEALADTQLPLMIVGETGTGKELMAEALHRASGRTGEFVPVNTAGLTDTLFSDALFGHVRGAFTGADQQRQGLIEKARDGTIFLDEIGDISQESQVKLLRLLQDGTYYPCGADTQKRSRARVVAATSQNVADLQKEGRFRKDLFFRLQAHTIELPPLRERIEDIPVLLDFFSEQCCRDLQRAKPHIPPQLSVLLQQHPWPGNIRELRGMLFDAISRNRSNTLSLSYFREKIATVPPAQFHSQSSETGTPMNSKEIFPKPLPTIKTMNQMLIQEALRQTQGNKTMAAHILGISRQALQSRLKSVGD